MRTSSRRLAWAFSTSAIALISASAVFAQGGLEEITVTARRTEENLMAIPMAISAVSADAIQSAGIKDMRTLAAYTPGLHIDQGLTNNLTRTLTFRGLSTSSGQVFVDGISLAGNGTPYLGALDHVEVLVGPQSVYFGRATFQGALNFVTKKPADHFAGRAYGEFGSYGTHEVALTLEGPIVEDKLGVRITGRGFGTDGQWRNSSQPDQTMGSRSSRSFIGTAYFTPTDEITAKVFVDHEWDDSGPPAAIALKGNSLPQFGGSGTQVPGVTGGSQELFCNTQGTFGTYYCGALPNASQIDHKIISGNYDITPYLQGIFFDNRIGVPMLFDPRFLQHNGGKAVTDMVHLSVEYAATSGWTFQSLSGWHHTLGQSINAPNYRDTRDVPNPQFNTPIAAGQPCCRLNYISFHLMQQSINNDYNQEFRVSTPQTWRLRGTAGASYLYTTSPGNTNFGQSKTVPQYQGSLTAQRTKTPAIYGGLYYDLMDTLTLTAEARYQWDTVIATTWYPTVAAPRSDKYGSFSPRVSLDYKYASDSLLYGLFSRGYRRGGFNSILVGQPASVLAQLAPIGAAETFGQEKLDNFEAGWKSTWLGGLARTRLTGYYQLWRNGQVPSIISFVQPNGGVVNTSVTTNGGAVDLYGTEFEADWAPSEKLTLNATFNWETSKIKAYNYTPVGTQIRRSTNITGNRFWGSPQLKWSVSPTYTDHLSGDWDWYTRLDWRYRGKYYIDGTNLAWLPGNHNLDLRFGIQHASLKIEAYVTNLLDSRNFTQGEYGADSSSSTGGSIENEIRLGLPYKRAFGINMTYDF